MCTLSCTIDLGYARLQRIIYDVIRKDKMSTNRKVTDTRKVQGYILANEKVLGQSHRCICRAAKIAKLRSVNHDGYVDRINRGSR